MTNGSIVPLAGGTLKQGIDGSTEMSVSSEKNASAIAAQAEANVKARWAIAQHHPRDWRVVRDKLKMECARFGFADSAEYSKPIGGKTVEGPSIRFVEVALRCMGNVIAPVIVIADTPEERTLEVMVTDLETNITWPRQFTIQKTVERRDAGDRKPLGQRKNSDGKLVYILRATEDEFLTKEAAWVSKMLRMAGERIIPGDLIDDGMDWCRATVEAVGDKNLPAWRDKAKKAAALQGITEAMLKDYFGKPFEHTTKADLHALKNLLNAIKDGEATWAEAMDDRGGVKHAAPPPPAKPPAAPTDERGRAVTVESAPAPAATPPASTAATEVVDGEVVDAKTGEVLEPPAEDPVEAAMKKQAAAVEADLRAAAAAKQPLAPFTKRINECAEPHRTELRALYTSLKNGGGA